MTAENCTLDLVTNSVRPEGMSCQVFTNVPPSDILMDYFYTFIPSSK